MKNTRLIIASTIAAITLVITVVVTLPHRSDAQQPYKVPLGSMEGAPGQQGAVGRYQIIDTKNTILLDTQTGRMWERLGDGRDWFDAGPQWTRQQPLRR